jgi:hypothetical protein
MDSIVQICQQFQHRKLNRWLSKILITIIFVTSFFSGQLRAQCDSINLEALVIKDVASEVFAQHAFKVHDYTLELPQPIPDSMLIKSFLGDLVSPGYITQSFHPHYAIGCDSCKYVIFVVDSLLNFKPFVQRSFKRILDEDTSLLLTQYPIEEFLEHNKPACSFKVNEINTDTVNFSFHRPNDSIHWISYGGNVLLSNFYFSRVYFNSDYDHAVLLVFASISPDFYLVSKHPDGHWHIDKTLNSGGIF